MARSKFDTEKLVGVQLRAISGDIGTEFRNRLRELYDPTPVGDACYYWHVTIMNYFKDTDETNDLVTMVQIAYENDINLNESTSWKRIMRLKMGAQFIGMMDKFTQIPQLAARDISVRKEDTFDEWD